MDTSSFSVLVFLIKVTWCYVICFAQQIGFPYDDTQGFLRSPHRDFHMHHPHPPYRLSHDPGPDPPDLYPVQHAGVPRELVVYPLPLEDSDHELKFNVSWKPSLGPPARDYSVEIRSVTDTTDCNSPMCYEYNIPGDSTWWMVPAYTTPVAETCAVRPGCSYMVLLTAHPWDGHTVVEKLVNLDECVSGVCSCAHSPRLPAPIVSASVVSVQGDLFVNISWSLPPPNQPQRLPRDLKKEAYFVSIGKQMVTDAHPSPWFANTISRRVDADGFVSNGDSLRWLLLPTSDKVDRNGSGSRIKLGVKLLARVNLVDDRGCVGPAGNATAYDPDEADQTSYETYTLWALFGGACVLVLVGVLAVGARAAKRVLRAFRPAPVSAPAHIPRQLAWFPMQLRSASEVTSRGQFEQSPLYAHKEFESEDEGADEWEVRRSRLQLGALIGSGAFGRVHVAQLDTEKGAVTVAAKMLSENASDEEVQDFLREITMLKHVGSHKHVIRLIGCCSRQRPLIALLEHAPRGDLLTLLRAARGRRRVEQGTEETMRVYSDNTPRVSEADTEYTNVSDNDPSLADDKPCIPTLDVPRVGHHYVAEPALNLDGGTMREYALQVALGMRHLEERGITHRDLAARNILVDGAGVLKVADFGLSRTGVYVHTRANPVPLRWLAPEAILHSQYCSASDVWAFAVLLWEIATLGGFPYAELSNHQVPGFLAGGSRLPKPARASPRLYQVMVECWATNPQDRPTFAQLVDKLNAQRQLYVDLDCILPPSEEDVFSEYNFT